MHRRVEITNLPVEIHLAIIQSVLEVPPEIEIPDIPEKTYSNRFTRPAKTIRRVCQRWKVLVDLPSTYCGRITTALLVPDYAIEDDYLNSVTLENFRSRLQLSSSLLAVRLGFYPPTYPVREICHLFPYGDRLVKFEACLQNMNPTSHMIPLLGSFKGLPRLFDLKIHDVHPNDGAINDTLKVGLLEAIQTPPTSTFREICQSLPSLRNLDIYSSKLEDSIYIPSDLTSLKLGIKLLRLSTFLPPLRTSLRELKLSIFTGWSAEGDKSIFSLDSLVSLDVRADSQDLIDVLCRLKCARLEHATLRLDRITDPIHHSEIDNTPTSDPSLRTLCMEGFPLSLLYLTEALNLPEVLERLTVVSLIEDLGRQDNAPDLNQFDILKRMKSHTLEIIFPLMDCSHFLELYPSISTVQQLRIMLPYMYMGNRGENFEARQTFPKLQYLDLAGGYIH
jgi:hypothetical protein